MANDSRVEGRRASISDVAKIAGVAISSASAALNGRPGVSDATRARVRAVAEELGYVASLRAKSLSSKRAFAVGLVIHRDAEVLGADPFFGAYIAGVERAAAARGHAVVLQIAEDDEEEVLRYRELAATHRVDGILLNETTEPDPRIELVQELGLAAASVNAGAESPFPNVSQDSGPGVVAIIEHLIALGHRDIGHIGGPPGYTHTTRRESVWRSTLSAAGLTPGWIFRGHFTYEAGRQAADAWLALDVRPTAVFCVTDLCAIGFMLRVQEAGLSVPEDVSVAGFDGIAMGSYVRPRVTTFSGTPRLLGEAMVTLLLDSLVCPDERVPDLVLPPGHLVVRESTGRVPAADR